MSDRQHAAAVVVDTRRSPRALLRPVPVDAVSLSDAFWEPRIRTNREVTLLEQYRQCESTGRIDNFRRASGRAQCAFQGIFFNDSDVYKWVEAAAWSLAAVPDPVLQQLVSAAVDEIAAAQQPDGYLNTYFMFEREAERWSNLKDLHEIYCAGHLIQAAVALHRATGDSLLLDVARRYADCIVGTFGPQGKRQGACGHPEAEMAFVELARETGDARYLRHAGTMVDVRGRGVLGGSPYLQDHVPFREMDRMTGHAVRAVYLNCGAADIYAETGEAALLSALDSMWANMTERQMYVSGGVGSRYEGEAFGRDYELPNERAYTETCAAIGSIMWNWRMLALAGDARYADVMEIALYNGFLAGLSLDGRSYFYQNPLADDGTHRRQAWFGCACCPPNVARMLSSLTGYFHSVTDGALWTHLYAAGTTQATLPDGRPVRLVTDTGYPWDGEVGIRVETAGEYGLRLRVPAWCDAGARIAVNGRPVGGDLTPGAYAEARRDWRSGDTVQLSLPMPVRRVEAHPYVAEDRGRVALMRGPILYCAEQADNPGIDPRDIVLASAGSAGTGVFRHDVLGGVVAVEARASVLAPSDDWAGRLYRPQPSLPASDVITDPVRAVRLRSPHRPAAQTAGPPPVTVTAIPYYAWANREPGRMQVWLRAG